MKRILITIVASLLLAWTLTAHAMNNGKTVEPNTVVVKEQLKSTKKIPAKPKKVTVKPIEQAVKQPAVVGVSTVQDSIIKWANHYGVDPARMLRIADCESTYNPAAVNYGYYAGGGHPTGLFQYLPETWSRIGGRSPHGIGDIYNYEHQARVTAWAFANGYAGEWECQ